MKLAIAIWLGCVSFAFAGLDFPEILKEVHAPADVETVKADFEFTNKSGKPVKVSKYDAACSCMSVKIKGGKLNYAPGESGVVRAEFAMGNFSGTVDKVILLWLDDAPDSKPSLTLTVKVHIPVLVSAAPKTLKWEVGGKAEPQTVEIRMKHGEPIRVTGIKPSSEAFGFQLKTVEEGKRYNLVVTPKDMDSPSLGIFRIETDCKIEKHRIQQVFGVIRKPTIKR